MVGQTSIASRLAEVGEPEKSILLRLRGTSRGISTQALNMNHRARTRFKPPLICFALLVSSSAFLDVTCACECCRERLFRHTIAGHVASTTAHRHIPNV